MFTIIPKLSFYTNFLKTLISFIVTLKLQTIMDVQSISIED